MKRPLAVVGVLALSVGAGATAAALSAPDAPAYGATALTGRAVLAAATVRDGSAPAGAALSASDRANATANGLTVPATGPVFAAQPVQGISALVPTSTRGEFWALSDNGFGNRANSPDWQLWVHRVRPSFASGAAAPGSVAVLGGFGLSDPRGYVPWTIACDPARGTPLPPLAGNQLPATPPALCGRADQRRLTGFDFDLESVQVDADGTFWFGEEFGPYLLHTDARGVLLEAPIPTPGVRAPQNATLAVDGGQRPNLGASKGFEGMGISPDRRTLYPLLEGPVTGDARTDLRVYRYDIPSRSWQGYGTYRMEMPGAAVNTSTLTRTDGGLAYPGDAAPVALIGNNAIGELTVVNNRVAVVVERDGGGDSPSVPRFKKVFSISLPKAGAADGEVLAKTMLVDLMAVPDRDDTGRDGAFFRFPYVTIESVTPLDDHTLALVNDNNYPFSHGRSFSAGAALRPDDSEFITVHVGTNLHVDRRVLGAPGPRR